MGEEITKQNSIPESGITEQQRRLLILREWIRQEGKKPIVAIAKEKGIPESTFRNISTGFSPISDKMKITLEKAFGKAM